MGTADRGMTGTSPQTCFVIITLSCGLCFVFTWLGLVFNGWCSWTLKVSETLHGSRLRQSPPQSPRFLCQWNVDWFDVSPRRSTQRWSVSWRRDSGSLKVDRWFLSHFLDGHDVTSLVQCPHRRSRRRQSCPQLNIRRDYLHLWIKGRVISLHCRYLSTLPAEINLYTLHT